MAVQAGGRDRKGGETKKGEVGERFLEREGNIRGRALGKGINARRASRMDGSKTSPHVLEPAEHLV